MPLACGIVGLPNVGKSTLFNALTSQGAQASNYPFCTIDPNVGIVSVPDARLDKISEMFKPRKVTPTTVQFVDIAGLVRGASRGEGLGNQFLGHIREVNAIVQVVRCFEDANVIHVEGSVNPLRDIDTIHTELCFADLEGAAKALDKAQKSSKSGDKDLLLRAAAIQKVHDGLARGQAVRSVGLSMVESSALADLHFLTAKPTLYVCNVAEGTVGKPNPLVDQVKAHATKEGAQVVEVSAKVEAEIAELSQEERSSFLTELGLAETGLDRVIRSGYELLGLFTFFTAGEKECRAWTVAKGAKAPQAAGVIHSDFERGFICAEVYSYADLTSYGSEAEVKAKGLLRLEGKEYVMKDGDIVHFRFNV